MNTTQTPAGTVTTVLRGLTTSNGLGWTSDGRTAYYVDSESGRVDVLRPRHAYPHLAPPPAAAARRDRVVWDPLSDQPHQHAGRGAKLLVRLGDAATHLRTAAVVAAATPRVRPWW